MRGNSNHCQRSRACPGKSQVFEPESRVTVSQYASLFQNQLQLPHVAPPAIVLQSTDDRRRELRAACRLALGQLLHEVMGEGGYIFPSMSQRRNVDAEP